MDITEFEYRLEYSCGMCIHLLDTIETTLSHIPGEGRYLIDPDDARISDDDDIKLVIDPVDQYKCHKHNPVYREPSPVECSTCDIHDRYSIAYEDSCSDEECKEVEKMKHKDNPMTMKGHHDLLIFF